MKYFVFVIALLYCSTLLTQEVATQSYALETGVIANPERGFYHHTEVHSYNYIPLNLATLVEYREEEAITQILRVFYLEDYVDKPISRDYIDQMHQDFNTARTAGIKVIVRVAYTNNQNAEKKDARPEIVRTHIQQLREIFEAHSDVIAVMQTGFVGVWGEWYYSDHFATEFPWQVSEQNQADRAQLVSDLLSVLPADRMIQLRTPGYKMKIFDTETPLDSLAAYSQSDLARVGHHNDCFVASSNDFGTYVNAVIEKPYLEQETTYLPMGGETCALAPPFSDCENAYNELTRFHWSYLNIDYNKSVLNVWREQGCFQEVERNLGYRIALKGASLKSEIHPAGTFELQLQLRNDGFANPYNPRELTIILQNTENSKQYQLIAPTHMGHWPIGEDFSLQITAGFMDNIEEGSYKLFLHMPDKYASLAGNPAYSIRLANKDIWLEESGYHDLGFSLHIDESFEHQPYQGDLYFASAQPDPATLTGPKNIYAGLNQGSMVLFWGRSSGHATRKIERSIDASTFETLATLPAKLDFYKVFETDQPYYYRYTLVNENQEISFSDTLFVPASNQGDRQIDISIDGLDSDWRDIPPIASQLDADQSSYILRTYFDAQHANFALYGSIQDFQIYLNTDNDLSSGSTTTGILQGMDYRLEQDQILAFIEGIWTPIADVVITHENDQILEIQIPLTAFTNLGTNAMIPIVSQLNSGALTLSRSETQPATYIRQIPPQIPAGLRIENSFAYPDIRLEIHWNPCQFCEGYILESSENGIDFTFLKELSSDKDLFYHDFLTTGVYYYRIKSFNELGESNYSEVRSGTIGQPVATGTPMADPSISVFPNPSHNTLSVSKDFESYQIYGLAGKTVQSSFVPGNRINIEHLVKGLYTLVLKVKDSQLLVRKQFVKL